MDNCTRPVVAMETRNRRRKPASWADLPEDMLGDVLRLLPSFADRARLRAVCRGWRAAWQRQPHPPAPWLSVPGHCVSLPDGAIHRVAPLPEDACNARCVGSLGDWLALVPQAASAGAAPFLLNPFSSARIPLPPWTDQDEPIRKIIMSAAPDSSCVVAAMVDCGENRRTIAACRPGQGREGAWWPVSLAFDLQDVAFHEGRLLALASCDELVVFDDGELDLLRREPWRLHEEHLPPPPPARTDYMKLHIPSRRYLVECNGRLLMVIRHFCYDKTAMIEVQAMGPDGSWARVSGIVGRTLFVGDACSGAFPAAAAWTSDDMIRESRVCFIDDEIAISGELDERNRSAFIRTVEDYVLRRRLGNCCRSMLMKVFDRDLGHRPLRTVEAYVVSSPCGNVFCPGDSSARTGRWQLTMVHDFPRSIFSGERLHGERDHANYVVI